MAKKKQRTYTGASGQMAVMAELLHRQCNVAIPDVDFGTDVFAFHDDRDNVARIQVKTATARKYRGEDGYSAQFHIPMRQLAHPDEPKLFYAFAVRLNEGWGDFVVVSRANLKTFWNAKLRFGTENEASGDLAITIQFRQRSVTCGEFDLTKFRNAWEILPPLLPIARVERAADV